MSSFSRLLGHSVWNVGDSETFFHGIIQHFYSYLPNNKRMMHIHPLKIQTSF